MKYLKKFNEAIEPDEIKDFCEMYLAYLLDDGYALSFNESGRVTRIDFLKPKTDVEHISADWMNWDEIKDSFIPFLKMLDKQYDIKDNLIFFQIRAAAQVKMSFQDVIDDKVKEKIFSVTKGYKNHSYEHATVISSVKINVVDHSVGQYSWQIKEAISQEDIKDFCEQYLAYLLDDGYALDFRESGRITQIDFVKPINGSIDVRTSTQPGGGTPLEWFDWDNIKDHFIPFLKMLDREYDVKDNLIFFQIRASQVKMSFQDVIDDKVKEKIFSVTKSYKNHSHPKHCYYEHANWFDITVISSIRIVVLDHSVGQYSWQLKEAKEDWRRSFPDDELQEVCDTFLPYLYDEGFTVQTTVPTYFMFKKNIITLWKEQESSNGLEIVPFYWREIKDRFLPLFDYLNKNYPLGKVRLVHYYNPWERIENKKEVVFKSDDDKESWSGHPFSKFEEIMSRDAAYGRPMEIGFIEIEVQNLDEL